MTPEPLNDAELADFHHLLTGEAVSLGRDRPSCRPGWENVWAYQGARDPDYWMSIPAYNTDATLFRDEVRPRMRGHGYRYDVDEQHDYLTVRWKIRLAEGGQYQAVVGETLFGEDVFAAEQEIAVALARRALKEAQR